MAHFQNQYSPTPQTDQFGNPMRQTDEYGNPVHHQTGMTGATGGVHNTGFVPATGITGHHEGKLHRSGSSSSSSSEDDGQGGRRKKGIGQKIKEKLPGKHHDQTQSTAAATTPGVGHGVGHGGLGGGGVHEKKGILDKIKDKLPGHRDDHHSA